MLVIKQRSVYQVRMGQRKMEIINQKMTQEIEVGDGFKRKIVWINVLGFILLHIAACYGLWLCLRAKIWTIVYSKL